jgi:hypothetical protein
MAGVLTPKTENRAAWLDTDGRVEMNSGGRGGDLCGEGYAEDLEVGGGGWAIGRWQGA